MRRSKRWVSVGALTATLLVALGTSLCSVALAQGARWKALNTQVGALYQQGKYSDALPLAQEALKVAKDTFGPDHPHVATSISELALLYSAQGRHAQAEPLYKRALAIFEKALGPDHPAVATSLSNLAELYREQGRYAQAEPLHKRALAIDEKALGPDHPDVAVSLNNLAALYQDQGRYAQAEPLQRRALAIFEKALGPNHPNVATSLTNLAVLYMQQGQYAKAEPLHELKELDPDASVIMVTAVHEEEIAKKAMSEGAFEYITKPIDRDYLEMGLMVKIAMAGGGE